VAIETKALAPDLAEAYIDFFDHRAFSDGSPYYPCYCNAYNMSTVEIEKMREAAKRFGGGAEGWQKSLRESAAQMVKQGECYRRWIHTFTGSIARQLHSCSSTSSEEICHMRQKSSVYR